ncbi:MAG: outer membrane protein assembly factor BamA [Phycisphaerae bacterium]|nr:outer membrane protein assembly factor BamA [Phycisphaerae bacterium]
MSVNPAGPSRSLWLGVSSRHRMSRCFFIVVTILAVAAASSISQGASAASATVLQDEQLSDRPVSSIDFEGLERVSKQKVWNNIRSTIGSPYDPKTARGDVERLTRLGDFKSIDVEATLESDGTVALTYVFREQQLLAEVQVVGNRVLSDQALIGPTGMRRGSPRDDFLIERSIRDMKELYAKRGYYLVEISMDASQLEDNDILIFEVIEGPRVRVRQIEFVGNRAMPDKLLYPQIKTRTWFPFFRRGELDTELLANDIASLDKYYKDRGYLDIRVDRDIEISPNQKEAKVVFLIEEGPAFTVREITAASPYEDEPLQVFSGEQLSSLMELKTGDVFRTDILERSRSELQEAYGVLGYLDASVQLLPVRSKSTNEVNVIIEITEGRIADVGLVKINGNFLTKDKVIRRHIKLQSGRRYDATELSLSQTRIMETQLFNEAKLTVQKEDEENPGYRDVLVEVKEKNTGSFNFGVGFGSDSGVLGSISLVQNNFDVADIPETVGELFKGRAFRGAGQRFAINFQPGNEIFAYDISLAEPNIFETVYTLGGDAGYYRRIYRDYAEERLFANASISRRFGDIWRGQWGLVLANVQLDEIEPDAPIQIFEDEGPDNLVGFETEITRTTITTLTRPGSGSRLQINYANYGAVAGDVNFNRARLDYTTYLTMNRDFLGRISTLRLDGSIGWIFSGSAPTYERFYLGGRTLRGFAYREVSPKGTPAKPGGPTDIPIGGDFMLFLGAQYQFPIAANFIDGVFFIDSGTVNDSPGFDEYRIGVGAGVRVYIPQLGPTPMAFDFAFPLMKQENDKTEVFSFSAELPF